MTVLLLIALGFLVVLAYGAVALGFTHVVVERAMAEARRAWWRRLVG